MRTQATKKIKPDYGEAEVTYECIQHGAEEGFELLRKVIQIVGSSVGDSFRSSTQTDTDDMEKEITGAMLGSAVAKLMEQLDLALIKRIMKHTVRTSPEGTLQKVPAEFNKIYQGNYGELALALWFVLEHNFGPMWRGRLESDGIKERLASMVQHVA